MALKSTALTTVQRVADYLGLGTLTAGSSKYNQLELYINSVTSIVENYIGYQVKSEAISNEEYDADDSSSLVLKRRPISSVTLMQRTSDLNEDDWETVDSQYYHIDTEAGILYGAGSWKFARGRRTYRVSYTAGYVYDNSSTFLSDTDGADIELACWMMVATIYNRGKGGTGIKSESIGDYRVSYGDGAMLENDDITSLLDKYANPQLGGGLTPEHFS